MKQVKTNKYLVLVFSFFILSSCSDESELRELSKVYVDNLIVETTHGKSDSLAIKKNIVFEKYNISEEVYKEKIKEINKDYESWKTFFDFAKSHLDTLKAEDKRAEAKSQTNDNTIRNNSE